MDKVNSKWKYNKGTNCVDEQPTMNEPKKKFSGKAHGKVLGRYKCPYCGYQSSTSLSAMKHDCIKDKYDKHIASIRSIPVLGKVDWKDGEDVTGKFKEGYIFDPNRRLVAIPIKPEQVLKDFFDAGYDYRSSLMPEIIAEYGEGSCRNFKTFLSEYNVEWLQRKVKV